MAGQYGGLWIDGGSASLALSTSPQLMTLWSQAASLSPGIDCDLAFDGLRVKVPGVYWGFCSMSFTADATEVVTAQFYVNGVAVTPVFRGSVEGIASGGRVNMAFFGAGKFSENDLIQIYIWSSAAATTFTLVEGQFGMFAA